MNLIMWGIILLIVIGAVWTAFVVISVLTNNDTVWQVGCFFVIIVVVASLIMIVWGLFTQVFPAIGSWLGSLVK